MPTAIRPPLPVSLIFAYPALDFNFGSWMSPNHLKVLRQESMANFKGIREQKDHFSHASPLSVVDDRKVKRKKSWTRSFARLPFVGNTARSEGSKTPKSPKTPGWAQDIPRSTAEPSNMSDTESDDEDHFAPVSNHQRSISDRVQYFIPSSEEDDGSPTQTTATTPAYERPPVKSVLGTRLTVGLHACRLNMLIISSIDDIEICVFWRQNSVRTHDAFHGTLLYVTVFDSYGILLTRNRHRAA